MAKQYTVLRDFTYGWDFTLFDEDGVLLTTKKEADKEANDPEDDVDELMVAEAYIDGENVVAVDNLGIEYCRRDINEPR